MTYELFNMQGYVLVLLLGAIGMKMCTRRRRLRVQHVSLVSADLLCSYSESHWPSIGIFATHTKRLPCTQGVCSGFTDFKPCSG